MSMDKHNYNHNSDVGHKNLIPLTERDPEEARAIRVKGGQTVAELLKKRRSLKETCQIILSLPAKDIARDKLSPELLRKFEEAGVDIDYGTMLMARIAEVGAEQADVKAGQFIRDTGGEMPTNKQEITASVTAGDEVLLDKLCSRLGIDAVKE